MGFMSNWNVEVEFAFLRKCFRTPLEIVLVLDLLLFIVGTAGIILQAPTLYDSRPAIDVQLSGIGGIHPS